MRAVKSDTGLSFGAFYLAASASAYLDYRQHIDQWLSDIWLSILTSPYSIASWALTGGSTKFEARGGEPTTLIPAIVLCTILSYGVGAALGALGEALRARLR